MLKYAYECYHHNIAYYVSVIIAFLKHKMYRISFNSIEVVP